MHNLHSWKDWRGAEETFQKTAVVSDRNISWLWMGLFTIRSETLIHKAVLHQKAAGKVLTSKPAFAEPCGHLRGKRSLQKYLWTERKAEHSHNTVHRNGGVMLGLHTKFLLENLYHGMRAHEAKSKQEGSQAAIHLTWDECQGWIFSAIASL